MKKLGVLILLFLYLFSLASVSAIGVEDQIQDVEGKLNNVDDFVNSNEKDQIAKDYLKQEWSKLIDSESFANRYPFLKPFIWLCQQYRRASPVLDPIIDYIVGFAPSLSWGFVLALMIWGMLLKYSYLIYEGFRDFSSFSKANSFVIYSCILIILFVVQIIQAIVVFVTGFVLSTISTLFNTWWGQLITILIVILIVMLMTVFSKKVKVLLRWKRMQEYRDRIKRAAEEGERQTKRVKETADIVQKAFMGEGI